MQQCTITKFSPGLDFYCIICIIVVLYHCHIGVACAWPLLALKHTGPWAGFCDIPFPSFFTPPFPHLVFFISSIPLSFYSSLFSFPAFQLAIHLKLNLLHFSRKVWHLVTTVLVVFVELKLFAYFVGTQ